MQIETRHIAARAQAPYRDRGGMVYFTLVCPSCDYPHGLSGLPGERIIRTSEPHPDRCLMEVVCMGGHVLGDDILFPIRVWPMHFDAAGCVVPLRLVFWDREEA